MLKDIKLPEPLLEFIESTKQRLLAEVGTKYVDHGIELVWTDTVSPSYTHIIFYVCGFDEGDWIDRCVKIQFELNDAKPEIIFDCVPSPFISIECRIP